MADEWKDKLSQKQYQVLRSKGTEAPFTGALLDNKNEGSYVCGACGNELFHSKNKYESHSGWPSFDDVISQGAVRLESDDSLGMERTEVVCNNCDSHLGHVFNDGPSDTTGQRYCINSASLNFKSKDGDMIRGDSEKS
jgi:peptide-methionine (R)-S-oxide reductase